MKKQKLVIVESPTKAKTINKILGEDYLLVSSMGHLIDLPEDKLGVEIENDFTPSYVIVPGRLKVLNQLKKELKNKSEIYIATDPDREGEAIGWHLVNKLIPDKKYYRVVFHEITPEAIIAAFQEAREFDMNMVNAQIARRILDRLVGYFLSPLLWRKIVRGLSAGRVQSVTLRLIIERERQIQAFASQEYWEIEAELARAGEEQGYSFLAKLSKKDSEEIKINNQKEAEDLSKEINSQIFKVSQIKETERRRLPEPPFITSTLQQEAFNRYRFVAAKTMVVAQQLYEGIEIGTQGPIGLITYMRTDSTRIAEEALEQVRGHIKKYYGADYLPQTANIFKIKKHVQAAHEAIRPTAVGRIPESIKEFLTPEQYKLYELIYNRFVASQMVPQLYRLRSVTIQAGPFLFIVSGSSVIFDGFARIYNKASSEEDTKNNLPPLKADEILNLVRLLPSQHFTKPPARFSESSLIKALEDDGIGRPSTYAPIISTLTNRDYVRRIKGYFYPTELGFKVCDLLVEYFPKVMDITFTAQMEEELDEIEEGRCDRNKVLRDFYLPFKSHLDFAQENIKKEIVYSEEFCEKCAKPMVVKWGRKGKFLSCSAYPACKNSKSITTGIKCPEASCDGELIERRSRRGFFYGCSRYPKCRFITQALPTPEQKA